MNVTEAGIPVETVIDTVKDAIRAAKISTVDDNRRLRISAIQLSLNAIATSTAGAKVEVRIPFVGMTLKLGTAVTRNDTQAIDITLVPPDLAPRHEIRNGDIDHILVSAIETISAVIAHAAGGEDPFLLKESNIEISFAITRTGSVALVGEGENRNEVTHKLKITLEVPGQIRT